MENGKIKNQDIVLQTLCVVFVILRVINYLITALTAEQEWTVTTMTDKQYKKYKEVEEEIRPLKTFLKGFCTRSSSCPTLIFTKLKLKFKRRQTCVPDVCEIEISNELQNRILKVIKQYIDEKEKEQEEL